MGICESSNNQASNPQPVAITNQNQQQGNTLNTIATVANAANTLNSNQTNQQQQGGVINTITNALSSNQNNQQQQQGGVLNAIGNVLGNNNNTTTNNTNSKIDTATKVVKFGIENKDNIQNLFK